MGETIKLPRFMVQAGSTSPGKHHVGILDTRTGERAEKVFTFYPGQEAIAVKQGREWFEKVRKSGDLAAKP
jgi:hypothetical protein